MRRLPAVRPAVCAVRAVRPAVCAVCAGRWLATGRVRPLQGGAGSRGLRPSPLPAATPPLCTPAQLAPSTPPPAPFPPQGPSAREVNRDTTAFERARAEWSQATVSHRGKVGAGGDRGAEQWLG